MLVLFLGRNFKVKTNKKNILNKFIIILMIILLLMGNIPKVFAISGSGTGTWNVSDQYDSSVKTTDYSTTSIYGIMMRGMTNVNTGEKVTVFCAKHGEDIQTGGTFSGEYYIPTDMPTKEACKIAYFGWYQKYGKYSDFNTLFAHKYDYVFTQQYIWESMGQSNATFRDANIQSQYVMFKAEIQSKIDAIKREPSFSGNVITLNIGDTITLDDTNGVLKDYESIDKTINGITVIHNYGENNIKIRVNNDCVIEKMNFTNTVMRRMGLIKKGTDDNNTTVYFAFAKGIQPQLYSLDYNDPVAVSLKLNINLLGSLELSKTDDRGNLIEGAKFRVIGDNFNQLVTVTNGKIKLDGLKKGTYTIQEEIAPNGYIVNNEVYTVEISPNQTTTQAISNAEPVGTIKIVKNDSETGTNAQGDGTLSGAIYEVYANDDIYNKSKTVKYYSRGDLVTTRTTNEKGKTEDITNLPLGKYLVKEIVSPLGYLLDTNEYEVNLEYSNQNTSVISKYVTSYDTVKKMQVHIFKSGIKEQSGEVKGLKGAEFIIKLNSDVEKALNSGYSYEEIWNGIDKYGNSATVNKNRVAEAQKIAPNYDKITTDDNGNAYTTKKLPYGKYIVKETVTPEDFESAEDFTFSITKDASEINETAQKVKHIVVNNEQLETYIKLVKKDKETEKTVTLNSATFEIKATENIYDRGTGKVLYKKGETITQKIGSTTYSTFTTNADNIIVPNNSYHTQNDDKGTVVTPLTLPVGKYEILEIQTPNGFLKLEETVKIEINAIRDYDKDSGGDYIKEIVVNNEQPKAKLIIHKSIKKNENVDTDIFNSDDLSGIQFSLTAKEDIIDNADGSVIYHKGQVISIFNLDKNGNYEMTDLPIGKYELQEMKTLNGLVLDEKIYDVAFTQKDLTTKIYIENKEISNYTTTFEFSKTDIAGDKELIDAKLSVLDKNGNIIDTWLSEEKSHKIGGLSVGKTYILREEIAPNGYVRATDIEFKVENTVEIQKVEMIDKALEIVKTDFATGAELEGAELKVIDEDKNIVDEWVSTKEPHKVVGLEEDKTYKLIETTAPYGYEVTEEIEFTVTEDKQTQRIEMKDKPIVKNIKIIKIDSNTKEIIKSRFSFGIYEDNECTKLIKEVKSNSKDGFVVFDNLKYGIYYIKEITAPKGYVISDEIIKLEINDNGVFINDTLVEEQDNTYSLDFENIPVDTPKTEDERNIALLLILFILSSLCLTFLYIHKVIKRKNK